MGAPVKFLIDKSVSVVETKMEGYPELIAGQLQTPLSRYAPSSELLFAIDNGAFANFRREGWFRLLAKLEQYKHNCLFVTMPDIVGSAIRTEELFFQITQDPRVHPFNKQWAYVAQDGVENRSIPWNAVRYLFIGGTDNFKDSKAAYDVAKTAIAMGCPVHVGRVNTPKRYLKYADLGCDTCDGNGVGQYDHMLEKIATAISDRGHPTLFEKHGKRDTETGEETGPAVQ